MICQGDVSMMAEPMMRRRHNKLHVSHTLEQVSEAVPWMLMIIEAESDSIDWCLGLRLVFVTGGQLRPTSYDVSTWHVDNPDSDCQYRAWSLLVMTTSDRRRSADRRASLSLPHSHQLWRSVGSTRPEEFSSRPQVAMDLKASVKARKKPRKIWGRTTKRATRLSHNCGVLGKIKLGELTIYGRFSAFRSCWGV
jgi:hypothetical protein